MKKTVLLILPILSLLTCREPTALLDKLEDDVKSANGLYLEIVDISPSENGQYINPGEDIRIEFDRAIDLSSVKDAFSVIDSDENVFGSDSDIKSLSYSFDENSNILTIRANPYLDGLKQYTVSILDKIRGADGSALREPLSWSFSTSDAPRGYVEFAEDYTNDGTPVINIYSQGATYYTIAATEGGIDWSTDYQLTGNPTVVSDFDISGSQGTKSVCIQFRDGYVGQAGIANLSEFETDAVVYDTTPPGISFDTDAYRLSANNSSRQLSIGVSDNLSGVDSSSYLCENGTAEVLSNAATTYPTVTTPNGTAGIENDYNFSFTVKDRAGNSTTQLLTLVRDNVAPGVPGLSAFPASGSNLHTTTALSYSLTPAADADLKVTQFSVVNDNKSSGSWTDYYAGKVMPIMRYGSSRVYFRSVDTAGNYSSEISRLYYAFPSYLSGVSPSSGSYLTGDIAWPESSKAYINADYFRAYLSSSSRGPYVQIGAKGSYRSLAFVDATELSLSIFATYYWYFEVFDYNLGTYKSIYTSPAYYFRTSKF